VLILENVSRLKELPAVSYFMALPLKIAEGSGSPVRAVAFVPR
jgi:arylformamidase